MIFAGLEVAWTCCGEFPVERVDLTSREGTTLVIKNCEHFEVLASNKLDDNIAASPALAANELYLRVRNYLDCIAIE